MVATYENKFFENRLGQKVLYRDCGGGCPVIALHCWGGSSKVFASLEKNLSKNIRLISLDFRGHALSHKSTCVSINDLADDIEDLIKYLDIDCFVLYGWSLGGLVAFELIKRDLKSIFKVVLEEISPKLLNDRQWSNGIKGGFNEIDNREMISLTKTKWKFYSKLLLSSYFNVAEDFNNPEIQCFKINF